MKVNIASAKAPVMQVEDLILIGIFRKLRVLLQIASLLNAHRIFNKVLEGPYPYQLGPLDSELAGGSNIPFDTPMDRPASKATIIIIIIPIILFFFRTRYGRC